jgi:hypothetical protein
MLLLQLGANPVLEIQIGWQSCWNLHDPVDTTTAADAAAAVAATTTITTTITTTAATTTATTVSFLHKQDFSAGVLLC